MIQFSTFPTPFAPIGEPLRYTLTGISTDRVDLFIRTTAGITLGTKRFTDCTSCTFDIAPLLRRSLRFNPTRTTTGFAAVDDRVLAVEVVAQAGTELVAAPVCTILPTAHAVKTPTLLTTMPLARPLAPDACDQLTFVVVESTVVTVTAKGNGKQNQRQYLTPAIGLQCFVLHAADFLEAEQLTVEIEGLATVEYAVLPLGEEALRLAWRSEAGSIEHYTFPVVKRVQMTVEKHRAYGAKGYATALLTGEESLTIGSAYETPAVMHALSELLLAREVWWVNEEGYVPIDLMTDSAEIHRHGAMRTLSVEIRSTLKNNRLWSC